MIGNPLSPKLAELFMGFLEVEMCAESWFPRFWKRYVDDVIAIVRTDQIEELLIKLNERHPSIKFTIEKEENNSFSFLDTKLIREEGKISIDIFRKPTDQPLCIPYESQHDINHRLSSFESFLYRMWNLPLSKERRKNELNYIINMANTNGYKTDVINSLNEKHERRVKIRELTTLKPIEKENKKVIKNYSGVDTVRHAILPYYQPITGRLKNMLRRNNINTCYRNKGTLRNILGGVKKKKKILKSQAFIEFSAMTVKKNTVVKQKED